MIGTIATRRSTRGAVVSDHHLASTAGLDALAAGGSAADAAIAAAAVMTVVSPHSSGLGGDLFAIVRTGDGPPQVLEAVGRAGSGADPEALRAEGHRSMPTIGDVRAVTVPGCVDGWIALHEAHGRLPLADLLEPARALAAEGYVPATELRAGLAAAGGRPIADDVMGEPWRGLLVRRPAFAETLAAIAADGRDGFYRGAFGAGLRALAPELFTDDDVTARHVAWRAPLVGRLWGHDVWVPPPPSQAYLVLAAGWIAGTLDLPDDPDDPAWAHLLSECIRRAAADRLEVLHEGADGNALLDPDRLARKAAGIDPDTVSAIAPPPGDGCTTYLCAVDGDGTGVSLIQSIASVLGSMVVVPGTGVVLHNRGQGFSLRPGHPAELGPGRRPPHTLAPALVTDPAGSLRAVLGTRGADAQPQVVLQLLVRLLLHGSSPAAALRAGRWLLAQPDKGAFETWADPSSAVTKLEAHAPAPWRDGLPNRGHTTVVSDGPESVFGSAHVIAIEEGVVASAADPRTADASAAAR